MHVVVPLILERSALCWRDNKQPNLVRDVLLAHLHKGVDEPGGDALALFSPVTVGIVDVGNDRDQLAGLSNEFADEAGLEGREGKLGVLSEK